MCASEIVSFSKSPKPFLEALQRTPECKGDGLIVPPCALLCPLTLGKGPLMPPCLLVGLALYGLSSAPPIPLPSGGLAPHNRSELVPPCSPDNRSSQCYLQGPDWLTQEASVEIVSCEPTRSQYPLMLVLLPLPHWLPASSR